MSLYEIIKISEQKIKLDFELFHCDDIGLYVIGKYPRFKYGDFSNSENFNWKFHTIATIRLTILNLINRNIVEIYQVQKVHRYIFGLIEKEATDYYFKVVDLHLDKDWFSVLVHDAINEVNRSKNPNLYKYIKLIFDEIIFSHSDYRDPSRAFIIQILRKYSNLFEWIELIKKKKFFKLLDDYEVKVEEIYIPRINMQHKSLTALDSRLYHNHRDYSDFYHSLESAISRDLERRKRKN
ncbi:hypothetical protein [Winogradskyella sp.]|uniref:hypothetical protein n=1 Tax=Winogradskyella sp. TaxID=1883156 RepID=UPI00261EABA2|nr:hypothetical protein [Winogradskyella sp.]